MKFSTALAAAMAPMVIAETLVSPKVVAPKTLNITDTCLCDILEDL